MLMIQRIKVIPQRSYHKILFLFPAINNTFVFLGIKGLRQDSVTHMDSNGNILFEHTFQKPMDALGMLTQREAIMIQTRGNCITILNLIKHEFKRIPHHFFNQQSDQANIIIFPATKYLCIQQYGRYNDNRYKLSYYTSPLFSDSKPFSIYQAKQNQWTYQHITKKANQSSKIMWYKQRHDLFWQFKSYQFNNITKKGQFNYYKFAQEIGLKYNMPSVQVSVNNIWEMKKDQFMIVCISSKGQTQINKQLGVIQNNYVLDVSTGKVRQAKFSFGYYHDYLIDCQNIGRYSMFRTFEFQDGHVLPTPVFYIDNLTQKIIETQTWQCSYLSKYQYPGYDPNMLVQNMFENSDCEWFECIKKKIINRKQTYLLFLQQIYDKFEQELLNNVLQLLDDDEQTGRYHHQQNTQVKQNEIIKFQYFDDSNNTNTNTNNKLK